MSLHVSTQQQLVQQFYVSHQSWLQSWLCKKMGSTMEAADLTHDTFIKVLLKNDLKQVIEPRAYLVTIAHGLMVNFIRRRDMEQAYLAAMVSLGHGEVAVVPSAEEFLITLEKLVAVDRMLDGLPVKVKQAFLLHKLNGMTYPEIAADMGMSTVSIKKYIARAMLHCASSEQ